eukprot:m.167979 g.167979  ORF g.167979 m.167979 type:complete len:169 (+) comp31484_c0_seq1:403-909(+)
MMACEDHRVPDATYRVDDEDDTTHTLDCSALHLTAGKSILVRPASVMDTPQRSPKKSKICPNLVPHSPMTSSRFHLSPSSRQLVDPFDSDSDEPEPLIPGVLPRCCNCGCSLDSKDIYTCADGRRRRFCFSCPSPIRPTRQSKFQFRFAQPGSDLPRRLFDDDDTILL